MKKIVGLVLILAGLALGFFGLPSLMKGNSPAALLSNLQSGNNKAVTEKLSNIASNSVIEYDYTNAVKLKSSEKFMKKISIPFTDKNIVMIYDGKMKIGADVSELDAKVDKDVSGNINSVTIKLPKVEITSNEINRQSISFPVEKATILNRVKNSDYDELEKTAKEKIENTVKSSSVMTEAEQALKDNISGYLRGLYGEDVEVVFN